MDQKKWVQIKTVVTKALALDPSQHDAYIRQACEGDEHLLVKVRERLQFIAKSEEEGFLGELASSQQAFVQDLNRQWNLSASPTDLIGQEIGPYEISEKLGSGGMGTVYKAERIDGIFHQTVAIKLIKRDVESEEIVRRFKQEREILAGLSHPNIAQLYDGGVTADGTPYLIMEYVDGEPITTYCKRKNLDLDNRLTLFLKVCEAVMYAHRNLVVHRDIKPGNILVTDDGIPKQLDFGVAKLLDDASSHDYTKTRAPLTLDFAAPEQITGDSITTKTDVYTLGVLLFELLTATRPWKLDPGDMTAELQRLLKDSAPLASTACGPSSDVPVPPRLLKGDLDAIIAKCLRADPGERYETVNGLRMDILRMKKGEPVTARANNRIYIFKKFVKKYRGSIAAACAIFLTIIVGIVAVARQAERARSEAERAVAVKDFMISIFEASDPALTEGEDPPASELLRRGADRIQSQLADQPALLADLLAVIGRTQLERGLINDAVISLDSVLKLQRSTEHLTDFEHAQVLSDRGLAAYEQGEVNRAIELLNRARTLSIQAGGKKSKATFLIPIRLADMLVVDGQPNKAITHIEQAIQGLKNHGLTQTYEYAYALNTQGAAHQLLGNHQTAELTFMEALQVQSSVDSNAVFLSSIQHELGILYWDMGRIEDAEKMTRKSLDHKRRVYGRNHPQTLSALGNLAAIQLAKGDYGHAVSSFERSLEALYTIHGNKPHPGIAYTLGMIGWAHYLNRDLQQAATSGYKGYRMTQSLSDPNASMVRWLDPLYGFLSFVSNRENNFILLQQAELTCSDLNQQTPLTRHLCLVKMLVGSDTPEKCIDLTVPNLSGQNLEALQPQWQIAYHLIQYRCRQDERKSRQSAEFIRNKLPEIPKPIPDWLRERTSTVAGF